MNTYYVPLRCPNCGETNIKSIIPPSELVSETNQYQKLLNLKWGQCNVCGEIFPIPKTAKIV